ncbi:hypothetical protein [Catenuloplanes indicus]|uniref:Uncharacterized protein n=1 Tax=Catenuloplanes indicus TaxID=137267 RepID=A0AAE3W415_9ACTN|nr:hypothetical protein [Catenuloplanes indicus]MDQ0369428.1 hypothetical protein [Catenuloplanes indicus]
MRDAHGRRGANERRGTGGASSSIGVAADGVHGSYSSPLKGVTALTSASRKNTHSL